MRSSFGLIIASLALTACGGSAEEEPSSSDIPASAENAASASASASASAQNDPAPSPGVAGAPAGEPIRGPGGLEEKCLARVNEQVGGTVVGTNRIEEAESGVMIYINVEGATAPWQCLGYRDGTVEEIFFGGDEGAL